jgi:two-component system LytT family response regulator
MKAFLVDDEELALKRLARLLAATGRVQVIGTATDPVDAAAIIVRARPDLLFLDIEMPALNGFDLLAQLDPQPLVVFTTAYSQYALQAFGVNSLDYLLKPIEADRLNQALNKIDRIRSGSEPRPELRDLLSQLRKTGDYPDRIASRAGDRLEFIELSRITHFFASEKLTYAATAGKDYPMDSAIQELEQKLDPKRFLRIHRSTILNVDYLHELHTWFGGRMLVRLKDEKRTELTVARDRVKALKERLGIT